MSDKFLSGMKKQLNFTVTENGAVTHKTTGSNIIDLFGCIGALRSRSESDIIKLFVKAFDEDALIATKMLFYARDIRGGLGERRTFRIIFKWLAYKYPEIVKLNLDNVVEFGRYDDLFVLFDTPVEDDMIKFVDKQLSEDIEQQYPSLLAKWMPSENASSQETKKFAKYFMRAFNMSPKKYRLTLTRLRKKLNIVEKLISSGEWSKVDYSKVPSKAAMQYRNAFMRHDEDRYRSFLNALSDEDKVVKVNATTLFPYDIMAKIIQEFSWGYSNSSRHNKPLQDLYNAQWDALPNYLGDDYDDSLCMIDTSGSMSGQPIYSALALGIYAAQYNKGRFSNYFMTFSHTPELRELQGDDICEIVANIDSINVNNTNIEAAFDLILDTAIEENLSQEELPKRLIIITDLEFDQAKGYNCSLNKETLFETIKKKFKRAGYEMPKLVFWNVDARNTQYPMVEQYGIQFVSGHSQAIFEAVVKGEYLSPLELVLSVLNKERYDSVVVQ